MEAKSSLLKQFELTVRFQSSTLNKYETQLIKITENEKS